MAIVAWHSGFGATKRLYCVLCSARLDWASATVAVAPAGKPMAFMCGGHLSRSGQRQYVRAWVALRLRERKRLEAHL